MRSTTSQADLTISYTCHSLFSLIQTSQYPEIGLALKIMNDTSLNLGNRCNMNCKVASKIVDMDTMRILSRSKDLTNRFLSKY